jgi:hypothetical protein
LLGPVFLSAAEASQIGVLLVLLIIFMAAPPVTRRVMSLGVVTPKMKHR